MIQLFEYDGEVIGIRDFLSRYADSVSLTDTEKRILDEAEFTDEIPGYLKKPLTRAEWLGKDRIIGAERHGERSTYLREQKIKLKGCNPASEPRTFPSESLFFGNQDVSVKTIPYGILSAEQATREILGYAFFMKHGLSTNIAPVCVYPQGDGFCLAEETLAETRLESKLDFKGIDISNLMQQDSARERTGLRYGLETEVNLKGVNVARYSYQKARQLTAMNFNGGFRDLLNSNIGNDVIDGDTLYLCDFDTFHVVDIPENPTDYFLRRFYLQSFTEAAKSSLPIVDIVDTPEEAVKRYLAISSFNHDFRRKFYFQAGERGWNLDRLAEIEEWAIATPIFRRTVGEIVLSYERLKEIPLREPTYKPH